MRTEQSARRRGRGRWRSLARHQAARARQAIEEHNQQMRAAAAERHGTRRRAAGLALAGLVALASMYSLVTANVLAVNFVAGNQSYDLYADRIVGQYAAGFLSAQDTQDGADRGVVQVGIKSADIDGICAIASEDLPGPLGTISLLVTAGEPVDGTLTEPAGKEISAGELYVAADALSGDGENIQQLTLGQSADTLTMDGIDTHRGAPGAFGLQARRLQIRNLGADSYGIELQGSINLPDLRIRLVPGTASKSECAS